MIGGGVKPYNADDPETSGIYIPEYAGPFATPADGERYPTLAEFYAAAPRDVRFNIETKINPTEPSATASPLAMVQALIAATPQKSA